MQLQYNGRAGNCFGDRAYRADPDSPLSRWQWALRSASCDVDGATGRVLDFGGIRGAKKREYIAAVHAGLNRDYDPMTKIFREVIARTLKSVATASSV
jgi:hypothetical protein